MTRAAKWALGIFAYVTIGTATAEIATKVVGPADECKKASVAECTAARSVAVALFWPLALPVYLFIAAGRPE